MKSSHQIVLLLSALLSIGNVSSDRRGDDRHKGHTHHIPDKDGPKNVLKDKKYVQDYDHIKEDLQDMYNKDFSGELNEVELEIYYFQLHDLNNDKLLDGLELLAAMNHVMSRENEMTQQEIEDNPQIRASLQAWWNEKFEDDSKFIDEILNEEDLDKDGYLSILNSPWVEQRRRKIYRQKIYSSFFI
ncbi:multiple coagulation factor deficiency protein 2-like protein [Caerostris darwini]|uniref:Multiple coagulation factor deficiency protein 2-like protein n=1 Tax=Caerostris darwini TaxID=1538125 RepID=A0AAV4P2J6_9ARAC|nr:multiple coagulation factor deficiency protein 2-like protein [Caerostris darwini]